MTIWSISDLHLSLGINNKEMDIFGKNWENHAAKIAKNWDACIKPDDLVLIAGDISWAMKIENVTPDLNWIHERPGTKVMIKGNHDYWWGSITKVRNHLPPSILAIGTDAVLWKKIAIGGTRLWDSEEYSFSQYIDFKETNNATKKEEKDVSKEENEKIFHREIERLKLSLNAMDKNASLKIFMTHYPPISANLMESTASKILEEAKIDHVIFGHLHNLKPNLNIFGKKENTSYHLTSCDYINFTPKKIADIPD